MQHAGLLPHRKVIDNVATVLRLNGVGKKEARDRAHAVLETVGLDSSLANRYPGQLSGGQQQRVGVARGLVTDPNILLMDEPFGAVDPIVRDELQQELLRLQRELDKTIVFVTHDIDEAFLLGDQVVILKKGAEVAQVGSPADILAKPANDFVRSFVGLDKGHRKLHVEDRDGTRDRGRRDGQGHGGPAPNELVPGQHRQGLGPAAQPSVAERSPDPARASSWRCPIGWYANRHRRIRGVVLSLGGILYTIPSLAFFLILPSIIGTGFLDPVNVVVALTVYAVAIMVRSATDAFESVSPAVLDAATAAGFGRRAGLRASSCRWPGPCCWPACGSSRSAP